MHKSTSSLNNMFLIFFKSLTFTFLTVLHWLLNQVFIMPNIKREICLFIVYEEKDSILSPLDPFLINLKIKSHNIFKKRSFLEIKIKNNLVPFNRLIVYPFIGVYFSEKRFKNKLREFYTKNYYFLINKNRFKRIILYDEYSIPNNSLISASKKIQNCKVFALQHGIITPEHQGYIFPKDKKNKCKLPDYLITYGEYEKELLTKQSIWKDKQVLPLGCPRYDFLADYNLDSVILKNKLGIPPNKKILFWPTQTHSEIMSKNGENELNADVVFKIIQELDDWFLIIKFHPNERQNSSFKFYRKYQQKYNLHRCLILMHNAEQTYDCIKISNCVILKHSVVGKESILMNKPIINFELIKGQHLSEYKSLKSAMIIKKECDLKDFLIQTESQAYKRAFFEERRRYLAKHFNNFGKSAQAVVEFIKKQ